MQNKNEDKFNIIIVGDTEVGKTSLVMCYTEESFSDNYLLTVGNSTNFFIIFLNHFIKL